MTTSNTRATVNRPVSIGELTRILGVPRYDLSLALDALGVRPAFRIGTRQVPCYTPDQIDTIRSLVRG